MSTAPDGSVAMVHDALSPVTRRLIEDLARRFRTVVHELLDVRIRNGAMPLVVMEGIDAGHDSWRVGSLPDDLQERHVELLGPPTIDAVAAATNAGASVFIADFNSASITSWDAVASGHRALTEAATASALRSGLQRRPVAIMLRPRVLETPERHYELDRTHVPAALFDVAMFLGECAHPLIARGSGPYLSLSGVNGPLEARFWNDVLTRAEEILGLSRATVKVTVAIDTMPSALRMDSVLFELKDRVTGLKAAPVRFLRAASRSSTPTAGVPDRQPGDASFRPYNRLLVNTAHRRWVHAIGCTATGPCETGARSYESEALRMEAEQEQEVLMGFDGTSVADPALVAAARRIFEREMPWPNQIERLDRYCSVDAADLLGVARARPFS